METTSIIGYHSDSTAHTTNMNFQAAPAFRKRCAVGKVLAYHPRDGYILLNNSGTPSNTFRSRRLYVYTRTHRKTGKEARRTGIMMSRLSRRVGGQRDSSWMWKTTSASDFISITSFTLSHQVRLSQWDWKPNKSCSANINCSLEQDEPVPHTSPLMLPMGWEWSRAAGAIVHFIPVSDEFLQNSDSHPILP